MWFVPQSLIFEHDMSSFAMANGFNGLQTGGTKTEGFLRTTTTTVVPKKSERRDEQRARATCCLVFPSGDPGVSLKMGDPHMTMGFNTQTSWWFGCHFLFSHILGMSSSQLTFIFFRGVAEPPTSYGFQYSNDPCMPYMVCHLPSVYPKCWHMYHTTGSVMGILK